MSDFYLDSSALVKRSIPEPGTMWIRALTDPAAGHSITIAAITRVEVAAAFAARHRADDIALNERDNAVDLLLEHCDGQYRIADLTGAILGQAVALTQRYRLRGYDAVQLATALAANEALLSMGLAGLTFVVADIDLVASARAEGSAADDPNQHH